MQRARGQTRAGFAYVRSRPDLLLVVCLVGVVSAVGLNFPVTLALAARLERWRPVYGGFSSALAVGSLLAPSPRPAAAARASGPCCSRGAPLVPRRR